MSEQLKMNPDIDSAGLAALISRSANSDAKLPPVEKWNPEFCGDLDMEIKSDGTWYYQGTPIVREELVRLFASVLRKDENEKTYLVTPVEKVGIHVQDAHFIAVELNVDVMNCLLYTSPSPRDKRQSRMPSSA